MNTLKNKSRAADVSQNTLGTTKGSAFGLPSGFKKTKRGTIEWKEKISLACKGKNWGRDHSGKKNGAWKGGKTKTLQGYILIKKPKHPCVDSQGYIREHRFVVEKQIGRYLLPAEVVHHLGKKDDNRPQNLMGFINDIIHRRFHKNPNSVKPNETIFDGRKLLIALLFCSLSLSVCASSFDIPNNKIADAIRLAENSKKFPYGIKSIDTHGDEVYARKICLNTIRNNKKRFLKQTKYTDFIEFLGSRFCPPSAHSLNKNWVSNVRYFLKQGEK